MMALGWHYSKIVHIYYAMNILFGLIFLIATGILLFLNPNAFLQTMLDGAEKSATTCFALLASYAVWLGLIRVWEECGVTKKVARLIRPITKKILKTDDEEVLTAAAMNFSVNLLGISGAATSYGIQTANLLDKTENAEYASAMFFVLNATSLQILPTSMIAVRTSLQSANPADIVLPTLLTTLFSTLLGVALTRIFLYPKKRVFITDFPDKKEVRKGVCTQ